MTKVLKYPPIREYLVLKQNTNCLYYRSAGGLYWKIFVNFPWPYKTTSNKKASFMASCDRDVMVALLNSSLFWWYYTATFDTFNVKDYMIFGFRFPYPTSEMLVNRLKSLSIELMTDYRTKAKHLMRGETGSYTIYAKRVNPPPTEVGGIALVG